MKTKGASMPIATEVDRLREVLSRIRTLTEADHLDLAPKQALIDIIRRANILAGVGLGKHM